MNLTKLMQRFLGVNKRFDKQTLEKHIVMLLHLVQYLLLILILHLVESTAFYIDQSSGAVDMGSEVMQRKMLCLYVQP